MHVQNVILSTALSIATNMSPIPNALKNSTRKTYKTSFHFGLKKMVAQSIGVKFTRF